MDKSFIAIVLSFKDYVKNTPSEEVMDVYEIKKEYGDIYIKRLGLENYYMSINDKGLIAVHDKNDREIWHMEKDIVEQNPFASGVLLDILKPYIIKYGEEVVKEFCNKQE